MHIAKCSMWYIVLVTAYTNFVLDATGLQLGILVQILLSFILNFHLWSLMIGGNRGMLNLKKLCCCITFKFSLLCAFNQNQQKLGLQKQNVKTERRFSNL